MNRIITELCRIMTGWGHEPAVSVMSVASEHFVRNVLADCTPKRSGDWNRRRLCSGIQSLVLRFTMLPFVPFPLSFFCLSWPLFISVKLSAVNRCHCCHPSTGQYFSFYMKAASALFCICIEPRHNIIAGLLMGAVFYPSGYA